METRASGRQGQAQGQAGQRTVPAQEQPPAATSGAGRPEATTAAMQAHASANARGTAADEELLGAVGGASVPPTSAASTPSDATIRSADQGPHLLDLGSTETVPASVRPRTTRRRQSPIEGMGTLTVTDEQGRQVEQRRREMDRRAMELIIREENRLREEMERLSAELEERPPTPPPAYETVTSRPMRGGRPMRPRSPPTGPRGQASLLQGPRPQQPSGAYMFVREQQPVHEEYMRRGHQQSGERQLLQMRPQEQPVRRSPPRFFGDRQARQDRYTADQQDDLRRLNREAQWMEEEQRRPMFEPSRPMFGYLYKSVKDSLKHFNGDGSQDPRIWANYFWRETRQLSEEERLQLLAFALKGSAAEWYMDQLVADDYYQRHTESREWLARIESQYEKSNSTKLADLESCRQNPDQPVTTFLRNLDHAIFRYDPGMRDKEKIKWLTSQMDPKFKWAYDWKISDDPTYAEAKETLVRAVEVSRSMPKALQVAASPKPQSTASNSLLNNTYSPSRSEIWAKLEELKENLATLSLANRSASSSHVTFRENRRRDNRDRSGSWSSRREDEDSRDSRRTRHSRDQKQRGRSPTPGPSRAGSESSRDRSQDRQRGRSPAAHRSKQCFNCEGYGHFADVCPSEKRERDERTEPKRNQGNDGSRQ